MIGKRPAASVAGEGGAGEISSPAGAGSAKRGRWTAAERRAARAAREAAAAAAATPEHDNGGGSSIPAAPSSSPHKHKRIGRGAASPTPAPAASQQRPQQQQQRRVGSHFGNGPTAKVSDEWETCASAWAALLPLLGARFRRKAVWQPFFYNGACARHLRDLGFTRVLHDRTDFFERAHDAAFLRQARRWRQPAGAIPHSRAS